MQEASAKRAHAFDQGRGAHVQTSEKISRELRTVDGPHICNFLLCPNLGHVQMQRVPQSEQHPLEKPEYVEEPSRSRAGQLFDVQDALVFEQ